MLQEKIQIVAEPPARARPQAAAPVQPADDPRIDLKELIRVMQRRRRTILWTAAVPVLLALLYGLLATPLYTSSVQILIDPRDRRIVSNEVTPETLAADGGVAVVESQLLVITSDTVLRRAIVRERLDTDPEFGGTPTGLLGLVQNGLAAVGIDLGGGSDAELKALRQLKKRIGVKRADKAFVVDVYVTTEAREKSVRLADALAQAYLADQSEARAAASGRASTALGGRLDALRARVQETEDRVLQYKEQHKILASGGVLVNEQQLNEMSGQLNTARGKTAEARARYEQIARARRGGAEGGAIPEAVLSQTIGQLRTQYAEVARQRAELGALVGPRHPSIVNLDAQIQGVQKLINEELVRIAAAARSELERAEASEKALEANLEALKQNAVTTNQASVRLRELERELEASRAVYQAFLTRARETGEQQSIDNTNARIISSATPPRDKSWPPRLLLLAVALVGGLGIGTGAGLMREYFDERLYSAPRAARPHRPARPRGRSQADAARQPLGHAGGLDPHPPARRRRSARRGAKPGRVPDRRDAPPARRTVRARPAAARAQPPGDVGHTRRRPHDRRAQPRAHGGSRRLARAAGRCRYRARHAVEDARCRRQCRPARPDRRARDARLRAAQRYRHRPQRPAASAMPPAPRAARRTRRRWRRSSPARTSTSSSSTAARCWRTTMCAPLRSSPTIWFWWFAPEARRRTTCSRRSTRCG